LAPELVSVLWRRVESFELARKETSAFQPIAHHPTDKPSQLQVDSYYISDLHRIFFIFVLLFIFSTLVLTFALLLALHVNYINLVNMNLSLKRKLVSLSSLSLVLSPSVEVVCTGLSK
jgi:hypothetical protein